MTQQAQNRGFIVALFHSMLNLNHKKPPAMTLLRTKCLSFNIFFIVVNNKLEKNRELLCVGTAIFVKTKSGASFKFESETREECMFLDKRLNI